MLCNFFCFFFCLCVNSHASGVVMCCEFNADSSLIAAGLSNGIITVRTVYLYYTENVVTMVTKHKGLKANSFCAAQRKQDTLPLILIILITCPGYSK